MPTITATYRFFPKFRRRFGFQSPWGAVISITVPVGFGPALSAAPLSWPGSF